MWDSDKAECLRKECGTEALESTRRRRGFELDAPISLRALA